jgi:hypothetical protein
MALLLSVVSLFVLIFDCVSFRLHHFLQFGLVFTLLLILYLMLRRVFVVELILFLKAIRPFLSDGRVITPVLSEYL